MNPHAIAKLRLSEYAREKNFAVSLTGEGSDEILLGYAPFRSDLCLEMRSKGGELAAKADKYLSAVLSKEGSSVLTGIMPDHIPKCCNRHSAISDSLTPSPGCAVSLHGRHGISAACTCLWTTCEHHIKMGRPSLCGCSMTLQAPHLTVSHP